MHRRGLCLVDNNGYFREGFVSAALSTVAGASPTAAALMKCGELSL
jgi:hypothetical protein